MAPLSHGQPPLGPGQQRRPVSDPNELSLGALRISDPDVRPPPLDYATTMAAGNAAGPGPSSHAYPEQQNVRNSGAASVYSLDSGMGAYAQPQGYAGAGAGIPYEMGGHQRMAATGRVRGPSWDGSMGIGGVQPMHFGRTANGKSLHIRADRFPGHDATPRTSQLSKWSARTEQPIGRWCGATRFLRLVVVAHAHADD